MDISSGIISSTDAIRGGSTATFNISGGSIDGVNFGIEAQGNSIFNITGGAYTGAVAALYGQNNGIINIYGSGLAMTGTTSGTITGTLQDGETIDAGYELLNNAQIVLHGAAPEPFSLTLAGIGLLGLALRKRLTL